VADLGRPAAGDRRVDSPAMFEELIAGWDGEEVVVRFDESNGAWIFVGVHSTVLGPGMGGTRMKTYDTPEEGLHDVLRLSAAMTLKQAAANLPFGGGKAVLAVAEVPPRGSDARAALLRSYARVVDALHGTYVTAADMNTSQAEMDVIGDVTPHVLGRSPAHGGAGDPGPGTALGVFHAIRATWRHLTDSGDLEGVGVLVQGVGSVGAELAVHLQDAGAALNVADVDEARSKEVAGRTGAQLVAADAVIGTACDVYAPCATGGVLSIDTIPKLACRAVVGAANNQLASPDDAERLREAGILYAPDFVVNAGGVIWLAGYETLGWDDAQMQARLAGIGETLERVFHDADAQGITTAQAAERLARARLENAPGP
jgi:leucine dehydrogenase